MQELFLLFTLLCIITEGAPFASDNDGDSEAVQSIWVDQGSNFTLPCGGIHVKGSESVMWVHEGKERTNHQKLNDGSIFFPSMQKSDSGIYSCKMESDVSPSDSNNNYHSRRKYPSSVSVTPDQDEDSDYEVRVRIRVRTPPHILKNVSVTPSTVFALVSWDLEKDGDGGYPISNFQIAYRLKNATENDWKICIPAYIDPKKRLYYIYQLHPNSSYLFKVWANNKLGAGAGAIVETVTKNDPQEIELSKHFLDGVDTFDVRIWIIAVGIVISTLVILGVATCCLFYKEYTINLATEQGDLDGESIELMPNIILNPGYDFQSMDMQEPDENSNDTTALRVNNNSVIHPARV